ncbi:MAG: class I SAM-dependent methyltransferase [Pseudomonadota bacterium]
MKLFSKILPYYPTSSPSHGQAVEYIFQSLTQKFGAMKFNLLDIGAGIGIQAEKFAKKGCDVTCIDNSPEMVALFKKRFSSQPAFNLRNNVRIFEDDWLNSSEKQQWKTQKYYHGVYALGNTIGYSGSKEDLRRTFDMAYNLLVAGGVFGFDQIVFPTSSHLVWSDIYKTDVDGLSFQRAVMYSIDENTGIAEVTLNVKWLRSGREEIETETYHKYVFSHDVVLEFAKQAGFSLIDKIDLFGSRYSRDSFMWLLKK